MIEIAKTAVEIVGVLALPVIFMFFDEQFTSEQGDEDETETTDPED